MIAVEGAPPIPGLVFRRFRGESDYPHIVAVLEACKAADGIERVTTLTDIAHTYGHLVNSDPERDVLFLEIDGQVAGYGRQVWQREENGPFLYSLGFNLRPEWRGRGVGRAVLRWQEARARELAAGHRGGEHLLQAGTRASETARVALLQHAGYTPVRYGYEMVRSLAEPITLSPMPDGVEVRPVGPEHFRTLWEADAEAFRDHWNYVPPGEGDYQQWLDWPLLNPSLWQVGWEAASGQIAGGVQSFVNEAENREYNRRRGWTENIFVRRPWRRRGLARALLTRSLQMFKDLGFTEAALGVDAENASGALRLYESVGFRTVQQNTLYRKALD